jgi:UDP-N-acetylmuramyl pentapeptide synthase
MKAEYKISEIAKAIGGKLLGKTKKDYPLSELLTDSRKLQHADRTLFFALSGQKLDGHNYLEELYKKGVRCFVVTKEVNAESFPERSLYWCSTRCLPCRRWRAFIAIILCFRLLPLRAATAKRWVKEWLYQLLHEDYNIVRSPKSFNSQIGVPLSLWNMSSENNLGIFEAGISEPDEMIRLEKIIRPNIGIFTNIGEAHSEGFLNVKHKVKEKLKLFVNCDVLIYCKDYADISNSIAEVNSLSKGADETENKIRTLSWSIAGDADIQVLSIINKNNHSFISLRFKNNDLDFEIPFFG